MKEGTLKYCRSRMGYKRTLQEIVQKQIWVPKLNEYIPGNKQPTKT